MEKPQKTRGYVRNGPQQFWVLTKQVFGRHLSFTQHEENVKGHTLLGWGWGGHMTEAKV